MSKTKKTKLADIAAATGYSTNTISRALNDKSDIAPATRQLIKIKAHDLGYIADSLAGSLRSGSSKSIAVIISDIANPHFGSWVSEIQVAASQSGYSTWIYNTSEDPQLELDGIKAAIGRRVDGIIICPTQENTENISLMQQSGIPFVLLGRRWLDKDLNYVILDDIKGGLLATRYLLDQGSRQILFLNGPCSTSSACEREQGFRQALAENDLSFDSTYVRSVGIQSFQSREIVQNLINEKTPFDGLLAFSDLIALEAMAVLPRQPDGRPLVPVVGFDDILSFLQLPVALSSVASAEGSAAAYAVEMLLQLINEKGKLCAQPAHQKILQIKIYHHT